MIINSLFSSYMYSTREENKLTQEKMAEILDVSVRWYQNFENGTALPNCKSICILVKRFGCDLEVLLKEVSFEDLLYAE